MTVAVWVLAGAATTITALAVAGHYLERRRINTVRARLDEDMTLVILPISVEQADEIRRQLINAEAERILTRAGLGRHPTEKGTP